MLNMLKALSGEGLETLKLRKTAFTLAEVLITLVIIGVIAAITIPILYAEHVEQQTVARVKKMYSTVAQVVRQYQFENACAQNIAYCFEDGELFNNDKFYKKFEKNLSIVKKIYPNESLADVDWLPTSNKRMNGTFTKDAHTWYGIFKPGNTNNQCVYYLLNDGSIITFTIPDSYKQSGFAFIDTNGKKPPNRVGKDQFPIGIGAYNNPKYEDRVHPYFNEDNNSDFGLCNISNNHECNADECTQTSCSPTAYVLKNNKLPKITW